MDCREFRNKHVAFVDDLLPVVEMEAMRRHVMVCSGCSRQDVRVRRSLLLVHNLPPIETSPDFMARLNARLAELGPISRTDVVQSRPSYTSIAAVAALAASLVAVAYMTVETTRYFAPSDSVGIATAFTGAQDPMPGTASMANAALASVPTGIPVWPAVWMVGQAPMRFASMETRDTELGR
ncbi:MAG TPA: zf-HC2 domain-containing protein [Gemmatimonadaceae bacterium]|nr:zf-HC2 domain-containing protein [Gemmatimonadaceae bacterium]